MTDLGQALTAMNANLLELEGWLLAFNEPEHPPAWVFPMLRLSQRLKASCEAVESLTRESAAGEVS